MSDYNNGATLLPKPPAPPSVSSLVGLSPASLESQRHSEELYRADKMLLSSPPPTIAALSPLAADSDSDAMQVDTVGGVTSSTNDHVMAAPSVNGHANTDSSQPASSSSPPPIFSSSASLTSQPVPSATDPSVPSHADAPSSPSAVVEPATPTPLFTIIQRCTICHQLRKLDSTAPPPQPIDPAFTCSQHPDPSLGSCALPMASVPARLVAYRSLRVLPPYNFMSLGVLPFDDREYERMFAVSGWNMWETLWLLERVRDEGVEAALDGIERGGQGQPEQPGTKEEGMEAPQPQAGLDVLYRRSRAECEARLLHVMSMAALHQHTLSSRLMPLNSFIQHQLTAKPKPTAEPPADEPLSPTSPTERPRRVRLSQHERMHTAVVRKRERAAASGRKRKRGGAGGGGAGRGGGEAGGGDDEDEAFRTGAEIKRTGARESSGRLAGQKRKQYEDGADSDIDREYQLPDDEAAADGRRGGGRGRRDEDEEVVEFRWRIEKILAERQRVVKMDDEGQPILDSSDSDSDTDNDDPTAPADSSFHSPRKLRLHREHSTDPVLQPLPDLPPVLPPHHALVTQYLVKIETQSYLHVEWHTRQSLIDKFGERNSVDRIGRYNKAKKGQEAVNADRFGGEAFDPRFVIVDRVIASEWVEVEAETEEETEKERRRKKKRDERERDKKEQKEQQQAEERKQSDSVPDTLTATIAANGVDASPMAAVEAASVTAPNDIDQPPMDVSADSSTITTTSTTAPSIPAPSSASPPPLPATVSAPPRGKRNVEMFLVKWQGLSYNQSTWESAEDVADEAKIAQFRRFNRPPATALPPPPQYTAEEFAARNERWYLESPVYKNKGRLREYQVDGLNWLVRAWHEQRNCILADEMGLGKTLQTVTLSSSICGSVEFIPGPFLVIVPLGPR